MYGICNNIIYIILYYIIYITMVNCDLHCIYVSMAFVHVIYVCMYIMLGTTLFNRYVVNYDFPRNIEDYVHRVGRTGRAG